MECMKELSIIQNAFRMRFKPCVLISPCCNQLSAQEQDTIRVFEGLKWDDLSGDLLSVNSDIVWLLSPDAFCYFLPGFLTVSIKEVNPDILVCESLLQMLDRSPDPAGWDDFFLPRWTQLSTSECEAVETWLWWLEKQQCSEYERERVYRAIETVELLATNQRLMDLKKSR